MKGFLYCYKCSLYFVTKLMSLNFNWFGKTRLSHIYILQRYYMLDTYADTYVVSAT